MEKDFYPAYYALEGTHWWFVGRRRILLTLLEAALAGRPRPLDILDFGCGTGAFLEHLGRFGTVSGVDGDPDAVRFCHERGRGEVQHVAAAEPLPFADESFDLVTTLDVIEHIEDDVNAFRELRRVMRPGGLLLVAVPAFMFLWGDQDEISHHFRRYTAPTLRRSLQAGGFEVAKTSYFNTWLFAPIAVMRVVRRALRAPDVSRTDFDVGPRSLNSALGALFGSEARLVARRRLPFGVSLLALAR
jgi:SAM-dependent methyltransferase